MALSHKDIRFYYSWTQVASHAFFYSLASAQLHPPPSSKSKQFSSHWNKWETALVRRLRNSADNLTPLWSEMGVLWNDWKGREKRKWGTWILNVWPLSLLSSLTGLQVLEETRSVCLACPQFPPSLSCWNMSSAFHTGFGQAHPFLMFLWSWNWLRAQAILCCSWILLESRIT